MSKRPGYKRTTRQFLLKFEGEEFEGLEVLAKSLPLREFLEIAELQVVAQEDPDAQRQILKKLADVIVAWNIEDDDDKPATISFDTLLDFDLPFVLNIFFSWMAAVSDIPNLSSKISNGGGTSQELSIPMDVS